MLVACANDERASPLVRSRQATPGPCGVVRNGLRHCVPPVRESVPVERPTCRDAMGGVYRDVVTAAAKRLLEHRAGGHGEVVATLVVALCLARGTTEQVGVSLHLLEADLMAAVLDRIQQLL